MAGREFTLTCCHKGWGGEQAFFHNDQGVLSAVPIQWTSLSPEDPLVSLSTGKSLFRVPDLLELTQLIRTISLSTNTALPPEQELNNV